MKSTGRCGASARSQPPCDVVDGTSPRASHDRLLLGQFGSRAPSGTHARRRAPAVGAHLACARACETRPCRRHAVVDARATGNPASRPVRSRGGRDARGGGRLEAPGAAGDARAPAGAGWSTSTRSSTACGGRSSRPLRATRCIITSPAFARRSASESIVGSADGYALKDARVDAVRFEELLAETRAALRDGDVRAAADAVASALALWRGPGAAGTDRHGMVQRRGAPPGDAARRRARGAVRGRARARRASGAHAGASLGARGQPLPRAAVGAADAGALSQRPPGGRARDVPGGAARARRRAGARAGARARGACRRRSSRTTRRSPPSPSTVGAAAICRRLRRRSSAARTSCARSPAFWASTAS